jgi:Tfp pilus assembly protein PilN
VLSVLEELTRILPDTARLTEFDQEGQRLRIAGVATDAAGLIPRLEASARFRDVRFLSQVMRVAETDTDRFEIGASLEEGGR